MFKKGLAVDQALLIKDCNWVHTCFVMFPLAVIFLDKNLTVINIKHLKPFRLSMPVKGGAHVLELHADHLKSSDINIGDQFVIE